MLSFLHKKSVYQRRLNVLSNQLSELLSPGEKVLDVGSGDGEVAFRIRENVDIDVVGIDVVPRVTNKINIEMYDGVKIPFSDNEFDSVIVCDVLHHTESPLEALREIVRVSSSNIIIKDHICNNRVSFSLLRIMDWFGNAYINVPLPYNYMSTQQWQDAFKHLGVNVEVWNEDIPLYVQPLQLIFGRKLHFVALLSK